jgi:hypothetical protein
MWPPLEFLREHYSQEIGRGNEAVFDYVAEIEG